MSDDPNWVSSGIRSEIVDSNTPLASTEIARVRQLIDEFPRQLDPFDPGEVTRYAKKVPELRWYLERSLHRIEREERLARRDAEAYDRLAGELQEARFDARMASLYEVTDG